SGPPRGTKRSFKGGGGCSAGRGLSLILPAGRPVDRPLRRFSQERRGTGPAAQKNSRFPSHPLPAGLGGGDGSTLHRNRGFPMSWLPSALRGSRRPRPSRRARRPVLQLGELDARLTPAVTATFSPGSGLLSVIGDSL